MPYIPITQLIDAVANTLGVASLLERSDSYDELREGMQDAPVIQVYADAANQDPGGGTDRTTFKAGTRQTNLVIFVDLYARQRSHIGEDMAAVYNTLDELAEIIESQDTKPYFSDEAIKAFAWSWQRVMFEYGDPKTVFAGARITINLRIF